MHNFFKSATSLAFLQGITLIHAQKLLRTPNKIIGMFEK